MVKILKVYDDSSVSGDRISVPSGVVGDTLVGLTATQTLTNKTLTAPVLGGSITGTYTLAGTPTFTSPTINTPTIATPTVSGLILSDLKRCTTTFSATSGDTGTTLTNVTGLTGFTLTASAVYRFIVDLQTVCTTNGGIAVAFKYTTATLTSIAATATTFAAASMGQAAQNTTTTDQTKWVNNKTAAWLRVVVTGTLVVNAGGTVGIQAAQETSHADTTSVYAGSWAEFIRLS